VVSFGGGRDGEGPRRRGGMSDGAGEGMREGFAEGGSVVGVSGPGVDSFVLSSPSSSSRPKESLPFVAFFRFFFRGWWGVRALYFDH